MTVLIIGGGIAGLTAALYLALANIPVTIFTGSIRKGRLASALTASPEVHNWPGFIGSGKEILARLRQQVLQFNPTLISQDVVASKFDKSPFAVLTDQNQVFRGDAVIVATGSESRRLNIPGESKFWGKGVYTCAVCDGPLFRGKPVVVVGAGDSAVQAALYLLQMEAQPTLIIRRGNAARSNAEITRDIKSLFPRVQNKIALQRLFSAIASGRARILLGVPVSIEGDSRVQAIRVQNEGLINWPTNAVFLEIGHEPNSGAFPQLRKHQDATIKINLTTQETNIHGVFAAGEVADNMWRQAVTSSGQGAMAAMSAIRHLTETALAGEPVEEEFPLEITQQSFPVRITQQVEKKLVTYEKPTSTGAQLTEISQQEFQNHKGPVLLSTQWCDLCAEIESKGVSDPRLSTLSKLYIDKYPNEKQWEKVVALPSLAYKGEITPVTSLEELIQLIKS